MRRYETIIIVRPGTGDADLTAVTEKATATIESFGGQIVKLDKWGLKKLAYAIKKENQGNYVYLEYAGQPDGVKEMERQMRIDDRVLKFMTVKTQEVYTPDPPKAETEEVEAPAEETVAEEAAE